MNNEAQVERIEQYLRGELSPLEQRVFEQEMAQDAELAALFAYHQKLHDALGNPRIDAFEEALQEARQRYQQTQSKEKQQARRPWYWAAAAVLALVLAATWLLWPGSKALSTSLEAQYAPYEAGTLLRGPALLQLPEAALQALAYYEQGQYAQAMPYLQETMAQDSSLALPRLLYGICLLETQNNTAALQHLSTMAQDGTHTLQGPAWWYLAVAQARNGQAQQARQSLQHLATLQEGPWSQKANNYLQQP